MKFSSVIFAALLIWASYEFKKSESVLVRLTNAVCESYNKSWVIINECRLRAISRNKTVFNFNGTILHPANDIVVEMEIFKRANGYKPWLFKGSVDGCRFLRKPYNPFMTLIYVQYKHFSNINHTCPYVGHQILRGFYLQPEKLRLPVPTGQYLLEINWVFDKKKQFITNLYAEYKED